MVIGSEGQIDAINPLDKDRGIRPGSGSRQSRDLQVDGKKLVIRQHIKKIRPKKTSLFYLST